MNLLKYMHLNEYDYAMIDMLLRRRVIELFFKNGRTQIRERI
jgi:hypothetical protein